MKNFREDFQEYEAKRLAPFATKSGQSVGRLHPEKEHAYRSAFQRDRDRIIHSLAFRKLEYKTQVFVYHEGDSYRTRLTHSLEVSQIARTIARHLKLNEDLAEAISLAHDLGHTPFGHSGQDVLNGLMKKFGGFEHNRQSFRVVTLLEDRYPNFAGLNLTLEVLEGITKHSTQYHMPDGSPFKRQGYPSLEAQICDFADEIAYNNHDIDDGLASGLINLKDLAELEIWQNLFETTQEKFAKAPQHIQIAHTIRGLINLLVTDLVETTLKNIQNKKIESLQDIYQKGKGLVNLSSKIKKQNTALKRFLNKKLYRHFRVIRMAEKAERVITQLFHTYQKNPQTMPPEFLIRYQQRSPFLKAKLNKIPKNQKKYGEQIERIVCDYIASMTDRFALDEYKKLFDPHEKV